MINQINMLFTNFVFLIFKVKLLQELNCKRKNSISIKEAHEKKLIKNELREWF